MNIEKELELTVPIYKLPGQALWRAFELAKLRELRQTEGFEQPVMEIGCADGVFSSLVFDAIADGIDINPRALDVCRESAHVYEHLHCMDARSMSFAADTYRTVFANCVIEHIPALDGVLADSFRVLKSGGKFVATVPLREMNDHLLLGSDRYAEMRRAQLSHVNLHTVDEWTAIFKRAGFASVSIYPYLTAANCHLWDTLDVPVCLGLNGRYNVGGALRVMGRVIPSGVARPLQRVLAHALASASHDGGDQTPCAAAIIAHKA